MTADETPPSRHAMEPASNFYVCTISRKSPRNWTLCREVGLYGIPGHRRAPSAKKGDHIFIWMGGKGYIAEAVVTEDPRTPKNRSEAPWPGGLYSFGWVIPFDIVLELKDGVSFPFVGQRQERTGVSKSGLQKSLVLLSTEGAKVIGAALRERAKTETNT
ncbi:hypothetical protein ACFW6Q_04380 [Streptomyces sp. NPDC058737]|uniref:hypothetical protein n=1 Tax=Streptomyces sp. NPDC058737 TaxID=3346617 RepID=UPI00367A5EF6